MEEEKEINNKSEDTKNIDSKQRSESPNEKDEVILLYIYIYLLIYLLFIVKKI